MSSNTSMSPPPIETLKPSTSKAAKAKKPASKKAASKASSHPSWKEIIKECIVANKEESRSGVSRSTIKKFAEETYHIDVSGTNLYQLNRAIASGAEGGIFALPKGPSGKVKLAPKTKPVADSSKENSKPPAKKAAVTKVDAAPKKAPVAKKSAPAPKKAAAAAPKKAAPATKKAAIAPKKAAAAPTKKAAAPKKAIAGASSKKPAAKSAAPPKKAATAKTAEKKKVSRPFVPACA
ncbi:hypothetical protein BJ138DRAFT_1097416 [Hygrophoropsis aurantiaca]|uniref:Uncharacterized protein n=1 Tax=Hygrophoropsis aurantiaca TaxID=72124 RepID=A0ACB8AS70_9AGAM|nr:hypothetical protein BJ138DRAFT_1097416 [Hygrophoropsis aurantiaca]